MNVEAKGAFGQFYFDERKHKDVVLLAAGSGITPMMSIIRYIDDLRLETTVTLLYCVRTNYDVIFQTELEELRARLKNFQLHLLLSQPPIEWSGPREHVSREFIGVQTLLETAEANCVGIPSSCRQGQYGTCRTKLLAGSVRMDAEEGLDPRWKAQGFVLACVGHAEGDVKLDA
jgi:ferredoxin-NADP reductase